jgi:alpha-beta hydrolase superfamily lysophospholipase
LQYTDIGKVYGTSMIEISTADGHVIRGTSWLPNEPVRSIIQIFHGLGEHHERYERFARIATAFGFGVVAHDHRGHGRRADDLGHFADSNGWQLLIDDALRVNDQISDEHAGVPVILLGHSMGSYIAQYFTMHHGDRLSALVLSGSTWPNKSLLIAGRMLAQLEAWRLGARGKSKLLNDLGFDKFNKPFEPARTPMDWLSRDENEVDAFVQDPLCGGPYSCKLWLDLLGGLSSITSDSELQRIRSDLPILLTGGGDDPVGGDKGITRLALHYAQSGHSRVGMRIYPGGRHEMFNETNRIEFCEDVLTWIEKQLPAITDV